MILFIHEIQASCRVREFTSGCFRGLQVWKYTVRKHEQSSFIYKYIIIIALAIAKKRLKNRTLTVLLTR